ncbi:MAG TPA: hypothetical protein VNL14_12130 [Candidatus Acidoferrales bacterium]|nr:hypothetical protein [Candidatus Acidoferrales bacterium]
MAQPLRKPPVSPFAVTQGMVFPKGGSSEEYEALVEYPGDRFSQTAHRTILKGRAMNKHLVAGITVGVAFTVVIVSGAAASALAEGGAVLLAAAVDGLLAGVCIGALIGANFALAGAEKAEEKGQARKSAEARATAA